MIKEWENNLPECMKLAYLPRPGIVRLRISVTGQCAEKAEEMLSEKIEQLTATVGDHIFGYDDRLLEEVIGGILTKKEMSLATAESCTGGNIARLITSVPGSSAYFKGGMIAYSNEVKRDKLEVSQESLDKYGAVSREVVEEMARGAVKTLGTDLAVATSGIAGPDGGSEEKPVGLVWIAVATEEKVYSKEYRFGGHRELVIEQASIMSLSLLFKLLNEALPA
jgi:nicotinamide-nucleotide amidase